MAGPKDVADGLAVFMFIHRILLQERLHALIDNSVEAIDILDAQTPHSQTMRPVPLKIRQWVVLGRFGRRVTLTQLYGLTRL